MEKIVEDFKCDADDRLLPDPKTAGRYDVTTRTLARWDTNPALGFPAPIIINNRKYRRLSELVRWERARAADKGAAATA
jgi:hypothetical protein